MSRYSKTIGNQTLNYGHDYVLGYWYDIENGTVDDVPLLVKNESEFFTNLNTEDFLKVLVEFGADENHIESVKLSYA